MSDYIDRRALLDALYKEDAITISGVSIINRFPAADVRPVVWGKWEKGIGENGVTTSLFCSVCHYENTHWHEWNYCPNCGADMREESDGE